MKCKECNGDGTTLCGHESHHIDSMSACTDPSCNHGNLICEACDGTGEECDTCHGEIMFEHLDGFGIGVQIPCPECGKEEDSE